MVLLPISAPPSKKSIVPGDVFGEIVAVKVTLELRQEGLGLEATVKLVANTELAELFEASL